VKHLVLGMTVAAMSAAVFGMPAITQDASYHVMADGRTLLGVPNMLNVASNLPFLAVGVLGLVAVARAEASRRWNAPYVALFAATALTTAGSMYYHLAPDNARLVWDRLPMTVGFAALLSAVIAERVGERFARMVFVPLLTISAATVWYWYASELAGRGDLRPYALVQFGSLAAVVTILALYRSPQRDTPYLVAGLAAYGAAKILELLDDPIFRIGHVVSGHTLKHLAAAGAVGCIAAMCWQRRDSVAHS